MYIYECVETSMPFCDHALCILCLSFLMCLICILHGWCTRCDLLRIMLYSYSHWCVVTVHICALAWVVKCLCELRLVPRGSVLMKVVRWRLSCQTQKHFARPDLSRLCQNTQYAAGERGKKGKKAFYSTMPCCLYTKPRLLNWNATLYFDKDTEAQTP